MIQRFFQFTILHLFCFLGGEEVEVQFQIEPFAIQAQGKETPIIFSIKPCYWTTGNLLSLSCSWKKGSWSKLSSSPFYHQHRALEKLHLNLLPAYM